ncbi:hypothetical protein [Streptomyces adelaidensis]|uniref:hypothetical protein n=1 Tax=Streptomyces adelaidensis TaxID=2796465 RepID=UPI001903DF6B|nr:hypothetical protein [Streptomyces adelaidensis]
MEIVVLSLLPVAVVAALVGRQVLLYPFRWGRWRYAFDPEHADTRRELHKTRLRRRAVEGQRRRKIRQANNGVTAVGREGRKEAEALEEERKKLLRDVPGDERCRLGDLVLYEHALRLVIRPPEGKQSLPERVRRELPLQGLKAKAVLNSDRGSITVTWPKGRDSVEYPRPDKRDVTGFVKQINAAVLRDAEYRKDREQRAADIKVRLRELQAETAERKAEKERERDQLAVSLIPDRAKARKEWEAACRVWEGRAGRRPRWIWRW